MKKGTLIKKIQDGGYENGREIIWQIENNDQIRDNSFFHKIHKRKDRDILKIKYQYLHPSDFTQNDHPNPKLWTQQEYELRNKYGKK